MKITFWGVRGSIAAPGPDTVRYGGNTSCVSVEAGGHLLVLDAGTGIRVLGHELKANACDLTVLITHRHSDHIQGFPHFEPLYEPNRPIHLVDYPGEREPWTLLSLFDGVHFPLTAADLRCRYTRVPTDAAAFFRERALDVRSIAANHPGGAFGYRVGGAGGSLVYMPDNELDAANQVTSFEAMAAFCRDADVLCHDAQYRETELPTRMGWGHSTVRQACRLAVAARVGHLVLFHHDPGRTDEELDDVQAEARAVLRPHGIACTAAFEGLKLELQAAPAGAREAARSMQRS